MYAVLGLLAAVENVLPPVPSDAAVALGAFLTTRGLTTPLGVFFVTWLANIGGAAGVYLLARRYGRALFATRIGRGLLAPRSLALIERQYLRLGTTGIFLSRFLPGIRAVVPPFAGLVGLGLPKLLVPTALASALWYGGITVLGAVVGSEWSRISAILAGVNRTLAIAAGVVIVGAVVWRMIRSRQRARERVWHATRDALDPVAPSFLQGTDIAECEARQAAAMLLLELAYADPALTPDDREAIARNLRERWGLTTGPVPAPPPPESERRTRFAGYARRIANRFTRPERLALVERLWTVAFGQGEVGMPEARLAHLARELLGVGPADLAEARRHEASGAIRP